ncbi:MAG: ATP-binding protein [Planctomycetota bacterium]|nr:ATP-binding protein [Planctomycetota bacterium]
MLLREESIIATWGLALAAILLLAIGASAWWAGRAYRVSSLTARENHVDAVGGLLQQSGEMLLASDDLSGFRRLVSEVHRTNDLAVCRVRLPDGGIVADGDPSRIEVARLPEQWGRLTEAAHEAGAGASGSRVRSYRLRVPGRGELRLELAGGGPPSHPAYLVMVTGIGFIGAMALAGVLVMYRRLRARLKGLGAIRDALLAWEGGETARAALTVSPALGAEASAWNALLEALFGARESVLKEHAAELLESKSTQETGLAAAFDALWDGILFVNDNMEIEWANGAAAVMLQCSREDLEAGGARDRLPASAAEAIEGALTSASVTRPTVEVDMGGDGDSGVLRFSVRPIRRDDRTQALVVIEDISQQRIAGDAQRAFLDQVAHELRTPLTNIRLSVDMVIESEGTDAAVLARNLDVINAEARRLEGIVGDMLSVAEIEAGSLQLRVDDVDLVALLRNLEREYQTQAAEREISLQFNLAPKLPTLQADREKLTLVLHNLLGNALKYTTNGGTVHVVVNADQAQVVIEVRDTGIGISEEDADRIFDRFYRANDERLSSITGSGLGLTLARDVIRLHGGDITVESALNEGSVFTATLPMRAAA